MIFNHTNLEIIFFNNFLFADSVVLQEGNIVTFGHPNGKNIQTGEKCRQPNSEYRFIVSVTLEHVLPLKNAMSPMGIYPGTSRIVSHCSTN